MQTAVTIHMAQKYRISDRNDKDVFDFLKQNFGCNRKIYNLCVDSLYAQLEKAGYQSGDDIPKVNFPKMTEMKKNFEYLKDADAQGLSNAIMDFKSAWKRYVSKCDHTSYTKQAIRRDASGTESLSFKGLKGMPKFHSKNRGYNSYRTAAQYPGESNHLKNATVRLIGDVLYVPKLKNGMQLILHRKLPENAYICNVTLSLDTDGHFYASIAYSYVMQMKMDLRNIAMTGGALPENLKFLGLDYSQPDFYVSSDGKKANYHHYYKKAEEKLGILQNRLAKKQTGSHNYKKLRTRIQKLHAKIKNQRNDFLQKESTRLVKMYDVIVVEDIDLRAMGGALKLGKNLHDNGFGMFRTMLTYKLERKGSCLVKVNKWFASTKTCSHCGHIQKMKLGEDTYVCEACGFILPRDWNAAVNIREEGKRIFLNYFKTLLEEEQAVA